MASNSSHSSMITPLWLGLPFEVVSEFLLCLIGTTSTLLVTVGLMVYWSINRKKSLVTIGITLVRNSASPTKQGYGREDSFEGVWKTLLIKRLLSPEFIDKISNTMFPPRRRHSTKKLILSSKSFSESSERFNDFWIEIREKLIKKSSTKGMNCCLNSSNLGQVRTQWVKLGILEPQQGQHVGHSAITMLRLIYVFTSNLNPHYINWSNNKNHYYFNYNFYLKLLNWYFPL